MAKNRKKNNPTTTTSDLQLTPSFKETKLYELAEMMGSSAYHVRAEEGKKPSKQASIDTKAFKIAVELFHKGDKLEEHECAGESCVHLHNPKFVNILLNAQETFAEEMSENRRKAADIFKPVRQLLFSPNSVWGNYNSRGREYGFLWKLTERPSYTEDGEDTGEVEYQWALHKVKHGSSLGNEKGVWYLGQAHHSFDSPCFIDQRGWKPNLGVHFNELRFLIPLSKQEEEMGIKQRLHIRAWDILQGPGMAILQGPGGVDAYYDFLEDERDRREDERAQELEEKKEAMLLKLQQEKDAADAEKKAIAYRKKLRKESLQQLHAHSVQVEAVVGVVQELISKLNGVCRSMDREEYRTLRSQWSHQSKHWIRGRRPKYKEMLLSTWQEMYTGSIFVDLVRSVTQYIPSEFHPLLLKELSTEEETDFTLAVGKLCKAAIDEVQNADG